VRGTGWIEGNTEVLLSGASAYPDIGPWKSVQPFVTSAWTQHAALLSRILKPDDIGQLAEAYADGRSILNFAASIPSGGATKVNRIGEQFAEIAEQHLECLTTLVDKVLLRDHRPGFETSIKPLRKRIEDEKDCFKRGPPCLSRPPSFPGGPSTSVTPCFPQISSLVRARLTSRSGVRAGPVLLTDNRIYQS
jgi:hypothetical protein